LPKAKFVMADRQLSGLPVAMPMGMPSIICIELFAAKPVPSLSTGLAPAGATQDHFRAPPLARPMRWC
jgi:hypothetical protein